MGLTLSQLQSARNSLLAVLLSSAAQAGAPVSPLVDDLLPRVVKVMGLHAPRNLKVKLVSREQAEAILRRDVEKDRDHLERLGEALIAVGLLPADANLAALAPDFNRQNVSGFYDLREHTLFLLTDQTDEAQRPIIAHELAHAVQDANADLQKAMRGSEDAVLAFTAVLEGQAQATAALVMDDWLRDQHVAVEGLAGILSDTTARSAAGAAERAPFPWLGLQLRFPYVAGRELVTARASPGDPIARGLLTRPPTSTAEVMGASRPPLEGVLHLEKLIPGAKPSISTTLGRANVELLGPAAGWRGDRLESVRIGAKVVVVWVIAFESAEQAAAFSANHEGARVVLTSGVPPSRLELVRAAALRVFP